MKPYKNIYIKFQENEYDFEGIPVIPYTDNLVYGVTEEPEIGEDDWYITCPCDFKELGGFNKVEKNETE